MFIYVPCSISAITWWYGHQGSHMCCYPVPCTRMFSCMLCHNTVPWQQGHASSYPSNVPAPSCGSMIMSAHLWAVTQHSNMVMWAYIFTYWPCPSTAMWWHEHTSSHTKHVQILSHGGYTHIYLHMFILICVPCPSNIPWYSGHTYSHTYHVPSPSHGGMGIHVHM